MTSGYNVTDLVQEAQLRWLMPGEVFFILQNYEEIQFTNKLLQKPPRGSLFLFNRRVLRFFRKDGHNWRIKMDGKTIAEAHERLRVGNVEALNCYYAHSEPDPKFQRRSYWMLDPEMDHIVLVHYRDVSSSYTLKAVLFATNNFSQENLITESPLGKVYRGQGLRYKNLVIQRLDSKYGQGNELHTEILTLKRLEHKNIASLFEYWVENNEKILIYKAFQGTLNQHLSDPTLTWSQRLQICIGDRCRWVNQK